MAIAFSLTPAETRLVEHLLAGRSLKRQRPRSTSR